MVTRLAKQLHVDAGALAGYGEREQTRTDHGRAMRWALRHPWRYAVAPGVACAIVVLALDGGLFGSVFTGLWHGVAAFGLTGVAGSVASVGRRRST